MQVDICSEAFSKPDGFTSRGGYLTTPLYLWRHPMENLEAATKKYIDDKINNISATSITSGILSTERFPSFIGEVVSDQGSGVMSLINRGYSGGIYTKFTVEDTGIISSVGNIGKDDVPNFSWTKIVSGKPTTLAGYGITDGVSLTGGMLYGPLTTTATPTETLHAVTKQYVDNSLIVNSNLKVGDIVMRASNETPVGFLRCNGAMISKVTYSALYAVIGDTFKNNITAGNGKPWQHQYQINNTQTGGITSWSAAPTMPSSFAFGEPIVTKNRVYMIGCDHGNNVVNTVYTAPINADGTLGAWTTGTAMPNGLSYGQGIVTKNRIYLIGGYGPSNQYSNIVYTAPINADGTLGAWGSGPSLPGNLAYHQAIVARNRVYVLGGHNGTQNGRVNTILSGEINSDGEITGWVSYGILPIAISHHRTVIIKDRLYLFGGWTDEGVTGMILYTTILPDGNLGTWVVETMSKATDFTIPTEIAIITTKNTIYLIGAKVVATAHAPINADGSIGTFSVGANVFNDRLYLIPFVVNNKIYMYGNRDNSIYNNTGVMANFSGGVNDYSLYYNGTYTETDPDNFQLPEFSMKETGIFKYYIKY